MSKSQNHNDGKTAGNLALCRRRPNLQVPIEDRGSVDETMDVSEWEEKCQAEERWAFEEMTIQNMEWAAKFLTRALLHYNKMWGNIQSSIAGETELDLMNALESLDHALDGATGFRNGSTLTGFGSTSLKRT